MNLSEPAGLDQCRLCAQCQFVFSPLVSVCHECGSSNYIVQPIVGVGDVEAITQIIRKNEPPKFVCRVLLSEGYGLLAITQPDVNIGDRVGLSVLSGGQLVTGRKVI